MTADMFKDAPPWLVLVLLAFTLLTGGGLVIRKGGISIGAAGGPADGDTKKLVNSLEQQVTILTEQREEDRRDREEDRRSIRDLTRKLSNEREDRRRDAEDYERRIRALEREIAALKEPSTVDPHNHPKRRATDTTGE